MTSFIYFNHRLFHVNLMFINDKRKLLFFFIGYKMREKNIHKK